MLHHNMTVSLEITFVVLFVLGGLVVGSCLALAGRADQWMDDLPAELTRDKN